MEKNRMQKLAGINEGTIFKNGKFEIPRWDTDYREGEPFYEMPKYGEWCKYNDVEKLEEIAAQLLEVLEMAEEDYYDGLGDEQSDFRRAARKVIEKAKSL